MEMKFLVMVCERIGTIGEMKKIIEGYSDDIHVIITEYDNDDYCKIVFGVDINKKHLHNSHDLESYKIKNTSRRMVTRQKKLL